MNQKQWLIQLKIYRKRAGQPPYYQHFSIEADPEEYILDLVERVWAYHDRTLTYRHACHHSTCGACGMRVNGKEKLTCITPVKAVARNGSEIKIEPLRNFPVLSDLVVDMGEFFLHMQQAGHHQVKRLEQACLPYERGQLPEGDYERLVDCIECGLCISACPSSATNEEYLSPAVLGAAHQEISGAPLPELLRLVDHQTGVWRCHSAFECSEVCPSNVDPGWRIMDLRKKIFKVKIKRFFGMERDS